MYSNKWNVLAITIALVCLMSGTFGQNPAPEQQPLDCSAAQGLFVNESAQFIGTWYEVARNPAKDDLGCVKINSQLSADNNTLNLDVTYSNTPSSWWVNHTLTASVLISATTVEGILTFSLNNQTQTPVFIKLLQNFNTYGVQFLAGCGYTNSSDNSTVFAYLLSNSQYVNQSSLNIVNNLAAEKFSDFSNSSNITAINQQGCFRSSANTSVPVLTAFFAVFFMLLKALHLA